MSENTQTSANAQEASLGVTLSGERGGILGLKSGMTQIYNENGEIIPVTVIDLRDVIITQVKNESKEGYTAVQVGMLPKKPQNTVRAEKAHFKASGAPGYKHVSEFRVDTVDGLSVGAKLSPDFVKEGDFVDVTAVSKGKGFQGGMKRYNMHGGFKTHGASLSHRSLGSIGNRADPAKCFKNKKMPGQMGNERVTMQNLKVVAIDNENKLMLIRGSVPGHKNSVVMVRKAIKKSK